MRTLIEYWEKIVQKEPNRVVLKTQNSPKAFTAKEIDLFATNWAKKYSEKLKREKVVFSMPNGKDWLTTFIGILKSNGIAIALDGGTSIEEQKSISTSAKANYIFINGELIRNNTFAKTKSPQLCLAKVTSGTTAKPKIIYFTHSQMIAEGRNIIQAMGIRSTDTNFAIIPFGHSYGLGNIVIPLLLQGTAIVCCDIPFPHAIAQEIKKTQASIFPGIPALYRAICESDISKNDFVSIRLFISAGSPLSTDIAQKFLKKTKKKIHNFYGSSETGAIAFDKTADATLTGSSIGTPITGVKIKLSAQKRICVTSKAIHTYNNKNTHNGIGSFLLADKGELNNKEELILIRRAPTFAKIAGKRISLCEIKEILLRHEFVEDAFVCALKSTSTDIIAAVVQTKIPLAALKKEIKKALPKIKIPKKLICLKKLPLTPRGKPNTAKIKKLLLEG